MKETLYTALIEENDSKKPFIQVYWAYADHLGKALETMQTAACKNGLKRPVWIEADPFDADNLPSKIIKSSDGKVLWSNTLHRFPPEDLFELPYGVIGSSGDGYDIGHIKAGFHIKKEDSLITIEVNVHACDLMNLYFAILNEYGKFRVFWYKVHGHWKRSDEDRIFVNEKLCTADAIIKHIETESVNSLMNGFVTLTAYVPEGATNINISDHKKIIVLTHSNRDAKRILQFLKQKRYKELNPFISIDHKMHHWHFRHPESLSYTKQINRLLRQGFSLWKPKD